MQPAISAGPRGLGSGLPTPPHPCHQAALPHHTADGHLQEAASSTGLSTVSAFRIKSHAIAEYQLPMPQVRTDGVLGEHEVQNRMELEEESTIGNVHLFT